MNNKSDIGFVARALKGATSIADPMSETWEANLPVSAVYIWTHNGKPEFKEGVPRYGGFAASSEAVDELLSTNDLTVPTEWELTDLHGREGAYGAYLTRKVVVAPIGFRLRWLDQTGGYQTQFDRENGFTRRHVQVLAGLGHMNKGTPKFAGYCVLTAKGYQAGNLMDSLRDFFNAIGPARRAAGADNGIAQCAFWHSIGTFGDEPEYDQVGSSAKSVITPLRPHPFYFGGEDVTEERLRTIFVGRENYENFTNIAEGAEEWLKAWNKGSDDIDTPILDEPVFATTEESINSLF